MDPITKTVEFLNQVCKTNQRVYADDTTSVEARAEATARHAVASEALFHLTGKHYYA